MNVLVSFHRVTFSTFLLILIF